VVDSPLATSSNAILGAAVAALRQDTDLYEMIAKAHEAMAAAEQTTSISFDWEREWLEAIAQGWPHKCLQPSQRNPD